MALSTPTKSTTSLNLYNNAYENIPVIYRGWLISTDKIKKQLWLRWQHPLEDSPRYGCRVTEAGITSAINEVKSIIDLTITLEEFS